MNNRYLYKAKRTYTDEWVRGNYIFDGITGKHYIHAEGNCVNESENIGEEGYLKFVAFEIDLSTLCQCTGLKDKKGRLIWENDSCIITRTAICVSVRIIYKDACFWAKDELYNTLIRLCDLKLNGYEIEVVNDKD